MTKKCYLICSSSALLNKQGTVRVSHYIGTTKAGIPERISQHTHCGKNHSPHPQGEVCSVGAARLAAAFVRAGGVLTVTRVWAGGHVIEKQLKSYGNNFKLCPVCSGSKAMKIKPKNCTAGRKYICANSEKS